MSSACANTRLEPAAVLAQSGFAWIIKDMNAQEVIEQIKHLPPAERAQVTRFVVENDDSWIPEEFKQAMKDAEEGRFVDMETALHETPPPRLQ
jgi:hypothetical protein